MATLLDHWRTLRPFAFSRVLPSRASAGEPWSTTLEDPQAGSLGLSGTLRRASNSEDLFILIHGLGGSDDSYYVREAAGALERSG